ncbi:transcriptional regulator [Companilactobacillus sp. RD055328]|uniref:ArsR/SmtB family transcription factor n=1 Tax=Companilactobacillus sp. RD055328 TaxID=2916634 RepID=UPI001FC80384|nr:metalloregulator ArsR/SmtB family transcription factor [Companilactobacillus sp. RD055328]GKQ42279.1 transcriptional regulator [Companilactobacillus sp. RD055328]
MNYENYAKVIKAMADPSRLEIIDMLSNGEKCACDILEHFSFSQPTLSHHMKVLQTAGIVVSRKESKWQHYTLNESFIEDFKQETTSLLNGNGATKATNFCKREA